MRAFEQPWPGRPVGVGFRPICDNDLPFLQRLYASTREQELAPVPWSAEQKSAFLSSQFEAQHRYYQEQFPDSAFLIVLKEGEAVGRIYLDRRADEFRLIDIALVPKERGRGLGKALLEELLDEARDLGLPVRIHVEKNNPAMRLYQRLGFTPMEDQGVYELMEWRPGEAGSSA